MVCESCKQHHASVHVQQIVNGAKTERNLCKECAAQFDHMNLNQFFQGFLGSLAAASPKTAEIICPECGLSYKKFKDTGRMGCKACYSVFREELTPLLKQLHGSSEHQGKIPKKAGVQLMSRRKIEALRRQLGKAVENEEYEEAARLRDEVKALEAGEPK